MTKWADFLISAVAYDSKHRILYVKQHKDTGESISDGVLADRNTIASNIANGISYVTIFSSNSTWKKGTNLRIYRIGGEYFIRTDGNKVRLDNLGHLLELEIPRKTKVDEKKETKSTTPETPPPSPRGSLPKGFSKTVPKPEPKEEATQEQIARLQELEKQIIELENLKQESNIISTKKTESKLDIEIKQQFTRLSEIEQKVKKIDQIQTPEIDDLISNSEIKEYNEKLSKLNNQIRALEKAIKKTRKKESKDKGSIPKITAYCVKCKTKRKIKDAKQTLMKNNKPAIRGTCSECSSKLFRIGKLPKL